MFAKTLQVAIVAVLLSAAASVRIGDEAFRAEACGLFYVFSERAIHVVDGATMDVVKTIDTDMDGNPLETVDGDALAWADVVYMEDASSGRHVIFANVRNESPAEDGSTQSEVVVVDTIAQEVIDRVVVGGRPVHLYGVFELNEMWTHSDAEATFDVIHLNDTGRLHAENIPGLEDVEANGNHGKLLVDGGLDFVGYATNTGEPFLFEIDLLAKEKIGDHPWSEFNSQCRGGHAISYSNINKHIYVEGTGCGSILEFDTVSKQYIHFWENVTGALYQTPDEDLVVAINKGANVATFFVPQNNGERSTIAYTVSIPGNPGSAAFWAKEDKPLGEHELEDHLVFFPLTRNTLKANIEAVTDLGDGRDVTDSDYYSAPFDCQYDESGNLALNEQGEPITPGCGSCALEGASVDDYDASLSGFAWVDMQEVVDAASSGETVEARLISAGAVLQGTPYSYSNECAYGRTYRVAMKGGKYVCTIADLPESSICCIDASTQQLVGCAPTSERPARIAYAPPRLGVGAPSCPAVEEDGGSTAGAGRKLL